MSLEVIKYENVSEWPIAEDNVLRGELELMGRLLSGYLSFGGQEKYFKSILQRRDQVQVED